MDKIVVEDLDLFYGNFQALKKINVAFKEHEITALIGPSGCGKSTLLKSLNRMNDLVEGCHILTYCGNVWEWYFKNRIRSL